MNEWATVARATDYLDRGPSYPPHRAEGEDVLLDTLPRRVRRVLDLGAGDGRLLALVMAAHPEAEGVASDFSQPMLDACRGRFAGNDRVRVVEHDLDEPLPGAWGRFDAVVSALAIHHCAHDRKRALYGEIYDAIEPGGAFVNLEHVASPTPALHERFFELIGANSRCEDPSNQLLDVDTQLRWMRELGFDDVDCHWKWRELALLAGVRPGPAG